MDRTSTTTYKTVYNIRLSHVLHPALVAKLWSFLGLGPKTLKLVIVVFDLAHSIIPLYEDVECYIAWFMDCQSCETQKQIFHKPGVSFLCTAGGYLIKEVKQLTLKKVWGCNYNIRHTIGEF